MGPLKKCWVRNQISAEPKCKMLWHPINSHAMLDQCAQSFTRGIV